MLKEYFEKRKIRKLFGKYLSEETIEEIAKNNFDLFEYVEIETWALMVKINHNNIEEINHSLEKFYNLIRGFEIVTDSLIYPILYCWQLRQNESENIKEYFEKTKDSFLGFSIILYKVKGKKGNIGADKRYNYTLLPEYSNEEILRELLTLKDGEIKIKS